MYVFATVPREHERREGEGREEKRRGERNTEGRRETKRGAKISTGTG